MYFVMDYGVILCLPRRKEGFSIHCKNVDTERFNQVESAIENSSRNWFPSAAVWVTDCD